MSNSDLSKKAANEQLMSCPFCGGKARVFDHIYFELPPSYGIICGECGAMSNQFYGTMGEAVAAYAPFLPEEDKPFDWAKVWPEMEQTLQAAEENHQDILINWG